MSAEDPRSQFLFKLPPCVQWEFCQVMDGLSDLDWTRFASEVLCEQTTVRLAARMERRTDWVMNQWENRNGRVGELIDLLERLQLLRPRDVILRWASSLQPPPPAAPPPPPPPAAPPVSQFDPPSKQSQEQATQNTCQLSPTEDKGGGGGRPLPIPAPPPPNLQSKFNHPPQSNTGVMCWSYEEVHAGTNGFSPALRVGEGGFGVVYRATLRETDCAVKRLKQDCLLDWSLLKESFQTEVDKLTKFRHPNIVDLLGFSEGRGSVCLIYSFMDNRSLEDQLLNECGSLSWSQRVSVVQGASKALRFLHFPPEGARLIHGDVKSSNILLDRHLVAKLADFGLARFAARSSSGRSAAQTVSIGNTATVRGTLAYLPDEYVRTGRLETHVDVYSFGVVLLEVLTGRRALERDSQSRERYLKDLVQEVGDGPTGSSAAAWREQLDHQLVSGGTDDPAGCMMMVDLACRCLDRNRKKRPDMTEVFDILQHIQGDVGYASSSSLLPHPQLRPPCFPRPPRPQDSSVAALSQQLSKLGPLEDTFQSSSSSSSSSSCSLPPPHPLHSSSSSSSHSSPLLSFTGPCETDESRGFSQYDLQSKLRSNGTSSRDCLHLPAGPADPQSCQPSVPTEDQYNFPPQPSSFSVRSGAGVLAGAPAGPDSREQLRGGATARPHGAPESLSPVGSLHSLPTDFTAHMNPSKRHFLQKKTLYEEGRIDTPELLSSDDLYAARQSEEFRGPEESDELDYLPAKHD